MATRISNSVTSARQLAVEAPLSSEQEERLATLVDELSESPAGAAQERLERLATDHADLAGHLRELFATMLVTDAVAEQSTIFAFEPYTRSARSAKTSHFQTWSFVSSSRETRPFARSSSGSLLSHRGGDGEP